MISRYGSDCDIAPTELDSLVVQYLSQLEMPLHRVLLIPPDHTRLNSMAGPITESAYVHLTAGGARVDILPAIGTHNPMTVEQLRMMFGNRIPSAAFHVHDWRHDVVKMGTIPGDTIAGLSGGKVDFPVDVEINRALVDGYDLILSIGQVVPHEVVGMANYTKNIVVGAGGSDIINKSHFLGAVCNMEKLLGRADTPVRTLFNHAVEKYLGELPIHYMLTVIEQDYNSRQMHLRGLYAGQTVDIYKQACELSRQVNITLLDRQPSKMVVYLDPHEFQSTWLGNKAIYRTRMAIADGGDLVILAPALREFGEDATIDRLIRRFGYQGTQETLHAVETDDALRQNLGAAAHLIHGSSEGRFRISYCPGEGGLTLDEIRSVGFDAAPFDVMSRRYNPDELKDGFNTLPDGEEIFFISNPALGLWAHTDNFGG